MEEKPEELDTEFDDNSNSNDNNDDISDGDSTYDLRYDDGDDGDEGDDDIIAPQRYDDSPAATQPEAVPKPETQEQLIQYDTTRSQPSSQRKAPSVYPKMHFGYFQNFDINCTELSHIIPHFLIFILTLQIIVIDLGMQVPCPTGRYVRDANDCNIFYYCSGYIR